MKKNLKILTIIFSFSTLFSKPDKPNIIYLMCDELAYYELSHMGNTKIKTRTSIALREKVCALRMPLPHLQCAGPFDATY